MPNRKKSYSMKSKKAKAPKNGVSKKIQVLKKEGYPQKRAVAIALNMKRKKKK